MASDNKADSNRVTITLKKNTVRAVLGAGLSALFLEFIFFTKANLISLILCSSLIIYFTASGLWLRYARHNAIKYNFFLTFITVDTIIAAFVCAYCFQSISISSLFFCILMFNSAALGALKRGVIDAFCYIGGIALAQALTGENWSFSPSLEGDLANSIVTISAYLCALAYLLLYAYYIYRRFKRVNASNQKLYNDQVLHKLRTYKLSRYVPPTVWNAINQGREASLKTERKRVTVFFSDIQGFSALSEELEAETLTELLNQYLTEMVKIASQYRGTIDKFMGDGMMVLFGDTNSEGLKADCLRCIAMAVSMRKRMSELETLWFNKGVKKPLRIRMGINTGYCTVGSFGTSDYMDYTVLGTHVNLASRLESAADPGEILISHETWSLIKDVVMCRDKGEIRAKGFSHPIKVYQVVDFRKDLGKNQSYFEERYEGFSMHLDLEKIRNFDKEKIIEQLDNASEKLRDKIIR
jgi:adenylate cyclase